MSVPPPVVPPPDLPPPLAALHDAASYGFLTSSAFTLRVAQNRVGLNGPSSPTRPATKVGRRLSLREARNSNEERRSSNKGDLRRGSRTGTRRASSALREQQALERMRSGSIMGGAPSIVESPIAEATDPAKLLEIFFEAVAEGDVDTVVELLDKGIKADERDDEGNTALLFAAEGEPQIVEALLKAGADVNVQNEGGLTALMRAVQYEDEAIIKMLLDAGASMKIEDSEGKRAADHAENVDVRIMLGIASRDDSVPFARNAAKSFGSTPAGKSGHRNSVTRDPAGRRASTVNVNRDVAALFDAVASGDMEATAMILDAGVSPDARDDDGNTPLIIAAEGEPGIAEMLVDRGADIDLQNKNGVTALIAAVKCEDTTLARQLIQSGASLELRDRKGRCAADFAKEVDQSVQRDMNALFKLNVEVQKKGKHRRRRKSMVYVDQQTRELLDAVSAGDLPRVKNLMEQEYPVNATDDDGNTALIFAAESEPLIVEALLAAGAEANHQNKLGATALMTAVRFEDRDSIKVLLRAGASTSIKNKEDASAIDLAAQTGNEEILRLVMGISSGHSAPTKTAPQLKMEVMRRGSLPSCSSVDRRTRAFFEAISEGDAERVERILQMAFEINCEDDAGCNPLHFAVEGEQQIASILISHGADLNAVNHDGETPLMKAVAFGDAETTMMLIKAGADVHMVDKAGRNAAHYADAATSSVIQNMIREASR